MLQKEKWKDDERVEEDTLFLAVGNPFIIAGPACYDP